MAITWAQVVLIAPALSTMTPDQQTFYLTFADSLNATVWGTKLERASVLVVAHHASLFKEGAQGPSGPITAEATARVSRSYAVPPASDPFWDRTSYGAAYKAMLRTLPRGFVT